MNQKQWARIKQQGFNEGVQATQEMMAKSIYAAAILAARREFGFGRERCMRLLKSIDEIVAETFTSEEIIDAAFSECGIKFNFREGIDSIRAF
ncbi:MAG: hypothetical protein IJ523_09775 [Succinivibrionaceae bacterium]|nr:hypothetical protein [Succinivibrionaceae bacterium]